MNTKLAQLTAQGEWPREKGFAFTPDDGQNLFVRWLRNVLQDRKQPAEKKDRLQVA